MSLFSISRKVRLRLEKIQRNFLLGGEAINKKRHLVKWPIVCLEKSKEGLGIKHLS